MLRRSAALLIAFFVVTAAHAQPAPPTPDEFLGYKLGDRFTPYSRILDYFDELARRSNLVTVQRFGETYEHRPLVLALITSAKNRANLDGIRANLAALTDPTATTPERAAQIAKSTPAVAWLAFGIHGNEPSPSEAAMVVASNLLRDPANAALLDNLIIIIDPLQNPDGRERYVQWFTRARGAQVDANNESFEHSEPWPGGRTNHYLIDMNRDWTWTSQQETLARVAEYRKWNPQVFVDFHEMGYQSSYTLAVRAARHATTGITTLRTASENREGLLLYTYDAMRKGVASGQNTYLIVPGSPNFRALLDMLERQSIRMGRLAAPVTVR